MTEPEWSAQTMGKSDRADNADNPPPIGGFGQLQPGEAPASSSLLFHWIGEFLSLAPLAALVAEAWVSRGQEKAMPIPKPAPGQILMDL